jgi:hypothetical protein
MPLHSGIADLVSKAVEVDAASDADLKARASPCGERVGQWTNPRRFCGCLQDSRDAKKLLGHVDRKLVKQARTERCAHAVDSEAAAPCASSHLRCRRQTVMTSVYGVTFMGARDQIWNRRARGAALARCSASADASSTVG